jgi:multidrug transporter EmrE-like cation transporter
MSVQGFFFVTLAALLTVVSNLMLRTGVSKAGGFVPSLETLLANLMQLARQPLVVTGVFLYGTASLVWFRVISTENLNSSYPVLVGTTFILVTFGATILFREPVSWLKVIGLALILLGILLASRS